MANIEDLRVLGDGTHSNTDDDSAMRAQKLGVGKNSPMPGQPIVPRQSVIKPAQRASAEQYVPPVRDVAPRKTIQPANIVSAKQTAVPSILPAEPTVVNATQQRVIKPAQIRQRTPSIPQMTDAQTGTPDENLVNKKLSASSAQSRAAAKTASVAEQEFNARYAEAQRLYSDLDSLATQLGAKKGDDDSLAFQTQEDLDAYTAALEAAKAAEIEANKAYAVYRQASNAASRDSADYQRSLAAAQKVFDPEGRVAAFRPKYESGRSPFAIQADIDALEGKTDDRTWETKKWAAERGGNSEYDDEVNVRWEETNAANAEDNSRLEEMKKDLAIAWKLYIRDAYDNADFAEKSKPTDDSASAWKDYFFGIGLDPKYMSLYGYDYENGSEFALYNYIYNTRGADAAKQYLDLIEPELASMAGEQIADMTDWAVAREVVSFAQGAMSGGRGMIQLFSEEPLPDYALDYAAQELLSRNQDNKLSKWLMEASQSAGNMLPGIAAGLVNPELGKAIFGASAAGSAYREYKQAGLDTDAAALGGVLRGASEVFTQSLLGGMKIPGFSGIFTGKLANALGKHVGSAFGKVAVEYGVDVLSEIIEENAQNYIEPAIDLMIGASDKYDAPGWDEFVDTTMSTLLMTAAFNAVHAKINNGVKKMQNNMQFTKDIVKPFCEETIDGAYANSEIRAFAEDTLQKINDGEVIDAAEFDAQMREALAKDAKKYKGEANPVLRVATPQEQAEARAEAVQAENPKATVISSNAEQQYVDTGVFTYEQSQAAGKVLDGILDGSVTKLDAQQVAALKLDTKAGAAAASKALGIEIEQTKATTASSRRAVGASIMQRYQTAQVEAKAQEAMVQAEQAQVAQAQAAQIEQAVKQAVTPTARPVIPSAAQVRQAQTPAANQQAQTPAPRVILSAQQTQTAQTAPNAVATAVPASAATRQTSPAQAVIRNETAAKAQKTASTAAQTQGRSNRKSALTYAEFKQKFNSDKRFRNKYDVKNSKNLSKESQTIDAWNNYNKYGLDMTTVPDGLSQRTVNAIDSLLRSFNLRATFADLSAEGSNGVYLGGNEIQLDVNPFLGGKEGAGNVFNFVVAHEVVHAIKARVDAAVWNEFEDYAIKAEGGEQAVKKKQESNKAYTDEAKAREDVAADFVGKLLADQATLESFCNAIENGKITKKTTGKIVTFLRDTVNKLRGKTSELDAAASELFADNIDAAKNAIRAMERTVAQATDSDRAAAKKNTAEDGAKYSKKDGGNNSSKNNKLNIANAADSLYNEREGVDGNVSDRMDRGVAEGRLEERRDYGSEHAKAWENGRGDQSLSRRTVSDSLSRAYDESRVVPAELYNFDGDRSAFSSALSEARNADTRNGWSVTPQSASALAGKKTFMDRAGTIGAAVTADGDIEAVFKNPVRNKTKRAMDGVIPQIIAEGGSKLDCYGEDLVGYYERYGFVPVARVEFNEEYANPGWDESKGRPDIFFMVHNGDSAETVVANIGQYEHMSQDELDALPRYGKEGYDEAAAYRDKLLTERTNTANDDIRYSKKPTSENAADVAAETETQTATETNAPRPIRNAAETQRIIEDARQRYGTKEAGENPIRNANTPNRMNDRTKVMETPKTAVEAEATPDSLIPKVDEKLIEGAFNYEPRKTAELMDDARAWVDKYVDVYHAYDAWQKTLRGRTTADTIARGWLLYNNLATASENVTNETERTRLQETAVDVLQELAVMQHHNASALQAQRVLKKQTPEMQYYAIERAVEHLQEEINKQFKKDKAPTIEMDKALTARWMQALREGDIELAYDLEEVLFQQIAEQIPKSIKDRLDAWRYLSMLGNPKTLVRNSLGNAAMTPVVMLKDEVGGIMEVIARVPKNQRTKSADILRRTKRGRALLEFASEDALNPETQRLMRAKKYSDASTVGASGDVGARLRSAIAERQRTFDAPILKQWQAATNYLMQEMPFMGDEFYKGIHYRRAFANMALARGYTVEDFKSGKVSTEEMTEMRLYATQQALKATFNDANAVSNFMRKMKFKGDGAMAKTGNVFIEGVVPFKGTPANILVRSVEYSPLGVLKSIYDAVVPLRKGKITATEYIERISSGLAGSMIWGLGYLLAALGGVRIKADDDDKREGKQNYSLEVFGISMTLDWLSPISIPFFMGAETQVIFNSEHSDGFLDAIGTSFGDAFNPFLEMSMLSGVKDLLDTFVYARDDGADAFQIFTALFVQPMFSYIGQYVPTLFGQIASALEPNRTTTYTGDVTGKVARSFIRNIAKITEKIPGVDWRQIDYVDEWGRVDENGEWYERIFNNFLNPAYVNDIVTTDADAEIARIEEATGVNISPSRRGYEITVPIYDADGNKIDSEKVRLDGEQYEAYQKEYGQKYAELSALLMASTYYDTLSDSDKAKAFDDIEAVANELGKMAALGDDYVMTDNSSVRKILTATESGLDPLAIYGLRVMDKQLSDSDDVTADEKNYELIDYIGSKDWTDEQKAAAYNYIFDSNAPTIGGVKPTADQKTEFRQRYSEIANDVFSDVMASDYYKNADAATKADMLADAKDLVYYYAKKDYATKYDLSDDNYDPATEKDKYDTLMNAGLSFAQAYEIRQEYKSHDNDTPGASDFRSWVDSNRSFTAEQKEVIKETYSYWRTDPVKTEKYDELTGVYDLSPAAAATAVTAVAGCKNDVDRCTAINRTNLTESQKWSVIKSYKDTTDNGAAKIDTISNAGVSVTQYIKYLEARTSYADGSWSQSELRSWLDAQSFTRAQKAVLWEIANSGWKTNPYK